jgi:hypothetical protein
MTDPAIAASLQQTAKTIAGIIPDRAFCLFVFPSKEGELFHYVANCNREQVVKAMKGIQEKGGLNLPNKEKN